MTTILLALVASVTLAASGDSSRAPLPSDYSRATTTRWLAKPILESRLVDGMESLSTWKLANSGQAKGEISLTTDRVKDGASALRLRSRATGDEPVPNSRYFGMASAIRVVDNEDWSAFNRISLWVYPDLPGFRVVSIVLTFHNDGAEKVPDSYRKMGNNYVLLRNHQWNNIVWEIANLSRNKVTGLEVRYMLQGHEPGASDIVTFDLDKLELQKVKADHFEGWNVAPGEIAFSHSGYQTGASKRAIASDLNVREFHLIDQSSGQPVLSKAVQMVKSKVGTFQVLDFSEAQKPGIYFLRAGARTSRSFPIGDDVWKSSIWKAINFFYAERCGYAIPGVHDVCHRDWVLKHGDKSMIVNGGWHDAGDLSQSFANTSETAYAMFTLAEHIEVRGDDPQLAAAILQEAQWGLDWILRTSFGDGFRPTFSTMDRWTNGIVGDADDMVATAGNNPAGNFLAAAAEAIAGRVLRRRDPMIAKYSLAQAEQDFGFALAGMSSPGAGGPRRGSAAELAGHGILAAAELWRSTGKQSYADKAFELARTVVDSQQTEFVPGLTTPLAGFFFTGPDKQNILRYSHLSHEGEPVEALAMLCRNFPHHPDWMKWYNAVTLYSEYYHKPMASFSAPYGMLASSLHKDDEYRKAQAGRGMNPESYQRQVLNGVKVGEHEYVRLFPVWFEFRGNHGTVLSANKGISSAAQLRGSTELATLAQQQLEWVMGRNPFVQSTMWGEGYDYAPQYTAMSGDLVGSLPVGIQSHADADAPYWPTENCHNWKEVWVFPVARWFWLMRDLAGGAIVEGLTQAGDRQIEFRDTRTNRVTRVPAQGGHFRASVSQGEYIITAGNQHRTMTLLPGGLYSADLRSTGIDFTLSPSTAGDTVSLSVTATGAGQHKFTVRSMNLELPQPERTVQLTGTQTLVWKAKITSPRAPWLAVIYPDDDLSQRKEARQ
ncbi:MAG: glycoside hydrolase family 9 protein [Acidobacteria bacterium]|nr:glycoside hydrolase family 9 protein [Acidobacteriota bacterium]